MVLPPKKDKPKQDALIPTSRKERGKLKKIGALWLKKGANGTFMSGTVNDAKVLVFKNNYKEEAKHPDYVIYEPAEESTEEPETITDDDNPF